MLGVIGGLKAAGYETVRLHSLHNPAAYWYAFHYEGRHSISMYLNVTHPPDYPPIPNGTNDRKIIHITVRILQLVLQKRLLMQFSLHSGVNHADELIYLFIYPFLTRPPTDLETLFLDDREKLLSSRMIHVWTNFAKHG